MKLVKTLIVALLLSGTCFASCPEISGYWNSSSGSTINICYPGNPDTFVIQVSNGQGGWNEYTASWADGFRVQFHYYVRNRQFSGVYDPNRNTIQVVDEQGNRYWWTR